MVRAAVCSLKGLAFGMAARGGLLATLRDASAESGCIVRGSTSAADLRACRPPRPPRPPPAPPPPPAPLSWKAGAVRGLVVPLVEPSSPSTMYSEGARSESELISHVAPGITPGLEQHRHRLGGGRSLGARGR